MRGFKGKFLKDVLLLFVYRVYFLFEMMFDFVWDYGLFLLKEERVYI